MRESDFSRIERTAEARKLAEYDRSLVEFDRKQAALENLEDDDYQRCPYCGSIYVSRQHHEGNALAPECDYWLCESCWKQWGHE